MAEMRASPVRVPGLKTLADIVRMVEERGQMEILPFNPATLFPVSSTTLENLAYGNLPMAIPSQSNIPITKTGRKQEVAELAGLLMSAQPAGRGVAKGANYLGDVLTQAVTRNPQATSMRALEEIARMSPVPQIMAPKITREGNPIQSAVVLIGDKIFTGQTHGQALNRAIYEGVVTKEGGKYIYPKDAEVNMDLFLTKDGRIVDRFDAYKEFDIGASESALAKGLMQIKPASSMTVDQYTTEAEKIKSLLEPPASVKPSPSYGMEHRPMGEAGGASRLHEAYKSFGEDVYGKNALQYFGSGDPREAGVVRLIRSIRDNPDREVTIYRGVPEGVEGKINPGDWITLDKNVAEEYGKVVSMKVKAKDITTWPDSLLEFGYFPE